MYLLGVVNAHPMATYAVGLPLNLMPVLYQISDAKTLRKQPTATHNLQRRLHNAWERVHRRTVLRRVRGKRSVANPCYFTVFEPVTRPMESR